MSRSPAPDSTPVEPTPDVPEITRFVILWHQVPPNSTRTSHFDIMLERGTTLLTWAADQPIDGQSTQWVLELAPHRLDYLSFEGELTADRGHVRRWDGGVCKWRLATQDSVQVDLRGQRWSGQLHLQRDADSQRWLLRVEPADSATCE